MGQHKIPARQAQIQKQRSEPSLPDNPVTKQIKATVIGFSRPDCKICFGRGRLGFDARYKDKSHIIPCKCIEYFDLETVQKSWEEARQEAQKRVDAQIADAIKNQAPAKEVEFVCGLRGTFAAGMPKICAQHGESCGIKLPLESQQMQSSSSSPSDSSNSSSSASVSGST
jgi:hypothetical protein